MKTKFVVMALALQGFAWGQEKLSVPLSKPGQPVVLKVSLLHSAVTVVGGNVSEVTVESSEASPDSRSGRRQRDSRDDIPAGMKRIDIGHFGLNIEEKGNEVTVNNSGPQSGQVTIRVPAKTSVIAKSTNGGVTVSGVEGSLEVEATNGPVTLTNISGAVVAHSLNGGIKAEIDRVAADQPMSFTSLNGKVDVTLPAGTKAKLRLKTEWGSVYSDFDMKVEGSKPVVEDTRSENGKYRVKMDRSVTATINGGGPEYLFQTMNGSILIHKK